MEEIRWFNILICYGDKWNNWLPECNYGLIFKHNTVLTFLVSLSLLYVSFYFQCFSSLVLKIVGKFNQQCVLKLILQIFVLIFLNYNYSYVFTRFSSLNTQINTITTCFPLVGLK